MKGLLFLLVIQLSVAGALAQGSVVFNNRVLATPNPGGMFANVYAPIYGPEPDDFTVEKHGNTSAGPPAGSQTYGGPLLSGTGYTVQLWGTGGIGAPESTLQLCTAGTGFATTTFRTGAATMGALVTLLDAVIVPNAPFGPGSRATLQLRAWNNLGGIITAWAAASHPTIWAFNPAGKSDTFTPPFDLGGGTTLPPNLIGLTSFNIHTIPEPGSMALTLLGAGVFFLVLRHRSNGQ